MDQQKKLYRSRRDKIFAGIGGGLADYLNIDATVVRVVLVLLFFVTEGFMLLLYIILAFVIPLEPIDTNKEEAKDRGDKENRTPVSADTEQPAATSQTSTSAVRLIIAAVLILVGLNAISHQFFPAFNLGWGTIWPVLLIGIGLYFILKNPETVNSIGNSINDEAASSKSSATNKKEDNTARLVMGVIIVILGMLFLAQSMGWLALQIGALWSLWPLLLIFFGLAILSPWRIVTWIVGIIVLLVIIWAAFTGFFVEREPAEVKQVSIAQEEGIEAADVTVRTGAGKLGISGNSEQLVTGSLESTFLDLQTSSEVREDIQYINVNGTGSWNWTSFDRGVNSMDLQLNSGVPLDLQVDTGAVDMKMNLQDVMAESVDIDTGASNLVLDLGDKVEESDISINAGASSIRITLPRTVGVRVEVDSGLSSINVQDFEEVESNVYESENFDEAEKIINIEADIGVSSFDVVWR